MTSAMANAQSVTVTSDLQRSSVSAMSALSETIRINASYVVAK